MTNRRVPVQFQTDRKSLLDVISKGSRTSKMLTMLDIAAGIELFRDKIISYICFFLIGNNVSGRLTKSLSKANLGNLVSSGQLKVKTEQWRVRSEERT